MITLYHSPGARSLRCIWLMEELGLDYDLCSMDFPPRIKSPEFLQTNALGSVPYLIDGNVYMNESCAMLQYLDGRYGDGRFSLSASDADYAAFLNWLYFGECSLTALQAVVLRYRFFMPKELRSPAVADDYQAMVAARLSVLSGALDSGSGDYLCGEQLTLADISVGYALLLMRNFKLDADFSGSVAAYIERLLQRPALQIAIAK